ncbi:MAG: hypothetical protein Tsb0010_01200 [Parvularculaceae bacterium]
MKKSIAKSVLKCSAAAIAVAAFASDAQAAPKSWGWWKKPHAASAAPPSNNPVKSPLATVVFNPISPAHGDINPFYGDINPFHGDINPFYGDIGPFWGDISPFWGDINPFHGDINAFWGDINPFHGDLGAFWCDISDFWKNIGPEWGELNAIWNNLSASDNNSLTDYQYLADQLLSIVARAEEVFGAAVQEQTSTPVWEGIARDVFSKYGIDVNNPKSLQNVSAADRSQMFLEFYDALMAFSGGDRADHWMPAVNWSPRIAQDAGLGAGADVGLLDGAISFQSGLWDSVYSHTGIADYNNHHGAFVGSLIVAPHDQRGVMGIAPEAAIFSHNPFDETQTADWDDVRDGIANLSDQGSDIINMSLGVSGYVLHQEWANVLMDQGVRAIAQNAVFVKAAGNDGVTQRENVDFRAAPPVENLLIVGSVNPNKEISYFSNRPGEACLTVKGICLEENKLKYRFLVAPGELILASDNQGEVHRVSGTSFAAPQVSGALALMISRWPWMKNYTTEAAEIILKSAEDLGDPGVDGVYGWGLLDVAASQQPLDDRALVVETKHGQMSIYDSGLTLSALGISSASGDTTITAFEHIGRGYRDFEIALSSLDLSSQSGADEKYLQVKLAAPANASGSTKKAPHTSTKMNGNEKQFNGDAISFSAPLAGNEAWRFNATATRVNPYDENRDREAAFRTGAEIVNVETGLSLQFGAGEGAVALSGQGGFGYFSDHDAATGGVNPVLGFASGGAYLGVAAPVGGRMLVSFGVTSNEEAHAYRQPFSGEEVEIRNGLDDYRADAIAMDVAYSLTDRVTLNAGYTQLKEATGLLGAQGAGALSLSGGATTDATTVGAEGWLTDNLALSFSATAARTRMTEFDASTLRIGDDGVTSTAFQAAATAWSVFAKGDSMRISFAQPLHVENGALTLTATQVIDRETGALGLVEEEIHLGGARPYVAETLYSRPIGESGAWISAFSRVRLHARDPGVGDAVFSFGSRFTLPL